MQPARVLGSITSTTKHFSLDGQRMVIVQPLDVNDCADGPPLVAIDLLGSRKGDRVILTSDGKFARQMIGSSSTPARWSLLGVIDA